MAKSTIYVLNGPNMNLLGTREPEKYGRATLADVEKLCAETAKRFGLDVVFRQSNREGELVDWIQEAHAKDAGAIVINPAGYTTTSIAIMDALLAVKVPAIEVHIVKSAEPPGGMGETGTSAIVPAIANAIFAATGKRLRKMPVDSSVLKQPA